MVLDGPGWSWAVRESTPDVFDGQKLPGWSGTVRDNSLIRGDPCSHRAGSGVIRSGAGAVRVDPWQSGSELLTPDHPGAPTDDPGPSTVATRITVLAPGRSGMIRVGTGMVRCHPCWHRVGTGVVRDGPWRLRAGSGMICTAAGAMPGRSGAVRSGTVLGPGRRSAVAIF